MIDREHTYSGAYDCCKKILTREGLPYLWAGWYYRVLFIAPIGVLFFILYEESKYRLYHMLGVEKERTFRFGLD
jgi:hypothetical protein